MTLTLTEEQQVNLMKSILGQKLSPPWFTQLYEVLYEPERDLYYLANTDPSPDKPCVCEHCGRLNWDVPEAPAWIDNREEPYHRTGFSVVVFQR